MSNQGTSEVQAPEYKGSCHCGRVTYTCRLDFTKPDPFSGAILTRCNCSICHKSGMLLASPQELTILTPEPESEDEGQTIYTFNTHKMAHRFCSTCGIRCYFRGSFTRADGTTVAFRRVNVLTLDGRVDGAPMDDLRDIEVRYWNGKSPDFGKGVVGKKPYEGGMW